MKKIFTGLLMMLIASAVFSQNVTHVESQQVGNTIEITYHLDMQANISILMSENGGEGLVAFKKISAISGDVGKNVSPGHKKIVWDVLAERDKLLGDNIVFKVIASESSASIEKREKEIEKKEKKQAKSNKYPNTYLVGLNVNFPLGGLYKANTKYNATGSNMNYDFYVGYSKNRFGMLLKFKSNFIFDGIADRHSYATNIEHFAGTIDVIFQSNVTRISVILDFTVRLTKSLFVYTGLGYGYRSQLIESEINYTSYAFERKEFFYDRYKSMEIDFGLLARTKFISFTAGASCIPIRVGGGKPYFELHVGVGYTF